MNNHFQIHNLILFILVTILLTFIVFGYNAHSRSKIYWTEEDKIRRANLNGSLVEDIATFDREPLEIAIDPLNKTIYWMNQGGTNIQRANLDGTDIQNVVSILTSFAMALDIEKNKIYWIPYAFNGIHHSNFDGSGVSDNLRRMNRQEFRRVSFPLNMIVDSRSEKLYWTDFWLTNIKRVDLDGSNLEDLNVNRPILPVGLALDLRKDHLYWSDNKGFIWRSTLDGNKPKIIISGLEMPNDIALDLHSNKIYWISHETDTTQCKIQRANLDGTNIEDILTGLGHSHTIALYTEELYDVTPEANKLTTTWANVKAQ